MAAAFKACSIDGCNNGSASLAGGRRGLCAGHYQRLRRHGDPLAGKAARGSYVTRKVPISRSRLYTIWAGMLVRCGHRPGGHPHYLSYYRDGGVTVCEAWRDLGVFSDWALSHGYADGLTIDRIDNDGIYEPSNCRWVSKRDNSRHCRSNKISMDDAREIRRLRATGLGATVLAARYGITPTHVRSVVRRKSWDE